MTLRPHPLEARKPTPSPQQLETAYNTLMIADALALIEFLQKGANKYTTLSAMFNAEGKRLEGSEGSEEIEVQIIPIRGVENGWFYTVKPLGDYVFVAVPVRPCHMDYGTPAGDSNPSSDYFRFTASSLTTFSDNNTNLMVNFNVVGYKPKQLLSKLEAK